MMKFSKTVAVTGLGAFILLFAVACGESTTDEVVTMPEPDMSAPADMDMTPSMPKPEPMHEISGSTFAGQTYSLASTAGKPAVVNFWFPSCDACRENLPDFQSAYEEYGDRVEFIGVFNPTVDSEQQAMNLLDELGITYPNLTDRDFKFALNYSVAVSPTTFFISRNHQTARSYAGGPIPYETLVNSIEELLNPLFVQPVQPVQPTTPTPPVQPTTMSFGGTGIYTVGRDIQPGVYVSTNRLAFVGEEGCRWSKQDSSGLPEVGPLEAIRATGVYEAFVQIESSDLVFESVGCGTWVPRVFTNTDSSNQRRLNFDTANNQFPAWSPDGSKIAFRSDASSNGEIYVMNADGSNKTQLTFNGSANYPSWSPDGTKIAFVSARTANGKIYVMDADGSNKTQLSSNESNDRQPAWSPDGTKIAFVSDQDGDNEIFVMDADGSNQTQLTFNEYWEASPAWSPDGTKIAFYSHHHSGRKIFVMDADGSNQTQLTFNSYDNWGIAWSPDGSKIAFHAYIPGSLAIFGYSEIFVMDADGSNQVNLTSNEYNDWRPVWSPDGSKIAFLTSNHYGFSQDSLSSVAEISVMNADGSNKTQLTLEKVLGGSLSWSPDGLKIVFNSGYHYYNGSKIYVMNADGSNQTNLTYNE